MEFFKGRPDSFRLCIGGGTINGNGQVWYDLFAQDQFILRPTLMGVEGLHNSVISNLNL